MEKESTIDTDNVTEWGTAGKISFPLSGNCLVRANSLKVQWHPASTCAVPANIVSSAENMVHPFCS